MPLYAGYWPKGCIRIKEYQESFSVHWQRARILRHRSLVGCGRRLLVGVAHIASGPSG